MVYTLVIHVMPFGLWYMRRPYSTYQFYICMFLQAPFTFITMSFVYNVANAANAYVPTLLMSHAHLLGGYAYIKYWRVHAPMSIPFAGCLYYLWPFIISIYEV